MKKIFIILIFIVWLTPIFVKDESYCHDKDSWKKWEELVQKYPQKMDTQMLNAAGINFCKKIEGGTM